MHILNILVRDGDDKSSFDFFLWPSDRKMKSLGPSAADDFFHVTLKGGVQFPNSGFARALLT